LASPHVRRCSGKTGDHFSGAGKKVLCKFYIRLLSCGGVEGPAAAVRHGTLADGARLRLSGRCARLVQPSRAVVARIDHDGGGVLHRDIARHGKPDIFNTDQGSQFTGTAFTGVLIKTLGITLDDPTLNVIRELKITAPPNGAVIVKVDPRCRSPRGPQIR
jgi:hypothetical protein